MAESRESDELFWVNPRQRGVMPLDGFHLSRSLFRTIRRGGFRVTINAGFDAVIDHCADRPETWINARIRALYLDLHQRGFAHSLEIWDGPDLAGGVYGVALARAFFGESMFSTRRDGSKVALAYLVDHLRDCGFVLFDTQFLTPHLASLGGRSLPRAAFLKQLNRAMSGHADFTAKRDFPDAYLLRQRISQTS